MPIADTQIKDNDRRFLHDFFSLGASVHDYTATALYHEAQNVVRDGSISAADRPKIQQALRAKIFCEAIASMETAGKLLNAISRRTGSGIACRYVNGDEADSERGLRLFKAPNTDILGALGLPSSLPPGASSSSLIAMGDLAHTLYLDYLEPEDKPGGRETKDKVNTYRAIKHGSNVVCDPRSVSIWGGSYARGKLRALVHWPEAHEAPAAFQMTDHIDMRPAATSADIETCSQAATLCGNLCQLVVWQLQSGVLSY